MRQTSPSTTANKYVAPFLQSRCQPVVMPPGSARYAQYVNLFAQAGLIAARGSALAFALATPDTDIVGYP